MGIDQGGKGRLSIEYLDSRQDEEINLLLLQPAGEPGQSTLCPRYYGNAHYRLQSNPLQAQVVQLMRMEPGESPNIEVRCSK
jgi:hypothetical protein